jgi:hypothetical protein
VLSKHQTGCLKRFVLDGNLFIEVYIYKRSYFVIVYRFHFLVFGELLNLGKMTFDTTALNIMTVKLTTLSIMTLSIMAMSIMALGTMAISIMTLSMMVISIISISI